MRMGRAIGLFLSLAGSGVLANGINPPRPAAGVVLQAQCKGKAGAPGELRINGEKTDPVPTVTGGQRIEKVLWKLRHLPPVSEVEQAAGGADIAG